MKLVVSLHDVAPPFETEIRRQRERLRAAGVDRVVLKVVPDWHGKHPLTSAPSLVTLLREEVGHGSQIVLHGLEHRPRGPIHGSPARRLRGALFAGDAAEFLTLPGGAAARAVAEGRSALAACGLPAPSTFCPPGWLITPDAGRSLRATGTRRIVTMFSLIDLESGTRTVFAGAGFMGAGPRQELGVAALNLLTARLWLPRAAAARIFLHPQRTPSHALDRVLRLIGALMTRGWQPVTFDDLGND